MLEIAPRDYLNSVVKEKIKAGGPYVWHDRATEAMALEKAKAAVLSELNGWHAQAQKLKDEVLGCLVYDRSLAVVDFVNSMGGRAKMFAVTEHGRTKVTSLTHDWQLKPVDSHNGLVPSGVALLAAKLSQNGFGFDEYLVAEPVPKPSLPKPKDPVLLGALNSPVGRYLVEIGRWAHTIMPGIAIGTRNTELSGVPIFLRLPGQRALWTRQTISMIVGLCLGFAIAKGLLAFMLSLAITFGISKGLKTLMEKFRIN